MTWFDDLPDICRPNVPLAPLTWFRLGGPAEWLCEPRDEAELSTILHRCRELALPVRFLGLGANLIVSDAGVRGAVVRLSSPHFSQVRWTADGAEAGAGVHLTKLVKESVQRGLAGLEVLAGIPGTIGGGIRMNCGGRYGEIAATVERVRTVRPTGELRERSAADMGFAYRHSQLDGEFVVSAKLKLTPGDLAALGERFREIWRYKSEVQPALEEQSAGCIFKNPGEGRSAGKLIDECGLKGATFGGAVVSDRHANFIVARPGAKASDVLELIREVQENVYSRTGVRLQREVEVW